MRFGVFQAGKQRTWVYPKLVFINRFDEFGPTPPRRFATSSKNNISAVSVGFFFLGEYVTYIYMPVYIPRFLLPTLRWKILNQRPDLQNFEKIPRRSECWRRSRLYLFIVNLSGRVREREREPNSRKGCCAVPWQWEWGWGVVGEAHGNRYSKRAGAGCYDFV